MDAKIRIQHGSQRENYTLPARDSLNGTTGTFPSIRIFGCEIFPLALDGLWHLP